MEIDRAAISKVTKFSYLKELLEPKVHVTIDGLPFTIEEYERVKPFSNQNMEETVKSFMRTSKIFYPCYPTIKGANVVKIHDFYEKLVSSVQSLETLGKLKEVNGYIRATLDKLEAIRGDLVQTDDG